MRKVKVEKMLFTPARSNKGQESFYKVLLLVSILALPGCMSTGKIQPLAPTPPAVDVTSHHNQKLTPQEERPQSKVLALHQASGTGLLEESVDVKNGPKASVKSRKKCRLKDRFDRKAVLAYEWNRSRLSMDLDGVNMNMDGNVGLRVEYKLKLQKWKNKKERCRYTSKWQGLVGSGYNEMFRREDDTMWTRIKTMRKKASEFVDHVF